MEHSCNHQQCPQCGCTVLKIDVTRVVEVEFSGDDHEVLEDNDGNTTWDNDSGARCTRCGHRAKLGEMTRNRHMAEVTVKLYIGIEQHDDAAAVGADAMNEILREHQRSFAPASSLLDYAIVGEPRHLILPDTGAPYEEGDWANAREAS